MGANILRSNGLVDALVGGEPGISGYEQWAADYQRIAGKKAELLSIATAAGNGAIRAYRRSLANTCARIGVTLVCENPPNEDALLHRVRQTNAQGTHGGTMVMVPLRDRRREDAICSAVSPARDIDGLGGEGRYRPVTPTAMRMLAERHLGVSSIAETDLKIGVIGNGKSVGTPLIDDLHRLNLDPVIARRDNRHLVDPQLKECDVIFSATGVESLNPNHINDGKDVLVIDAGVREVVHGNAPVILGDVHPDVYHLDNVTVTPPLGGVGRATATIMAGNAVDAAVRQLGIGLPEPAYL